MAEIPRQEIPAINPVIAHFDDINGTLEYVFDLSIGAPDGPDLDLILNDISEQYFNAVRLTRKEKWLKEFVINCGRVCIDGVINHDMQEYALLTEQGILEPNDETAHDQLDRVITHFAPEVAIFDELYGKGARRQIAPKKLAAGPPVEELITDLPDGTQLLERGDVKRAGQLPNLSERAAFLLKYAVANPGFRPEDFKNRPGFKKLFGPIGYKELKTILPSLLDEIIYELRIHGVKSQWLTTGQRQFTRHFLTVRERPEQAAPVKQRRHKPRKSHPTGQPVLKTMTVVQTETHRQQNEHIRADKFTKILGDYLISLLDETGRPLRANFLARDIQENLRGVTRDQARDAVNNVLAARILYRAGYEDGMVTVWHNPVERERSRPAARVETAEVKAELFETVEEKTLGGKILEQLYKTGHQNKGMPVRRLSLALETEASEIQSVVSKLVSLGILKRVENWERSHSPGSKKTKVMYLQFADMDVWKVYKDKRAGLIDLYLGL